MIAVFDKSKMHLQVVVGSLETYIPSEDVKLCQAKVDELKAKLQEFMASVVDPSVKEIEALVEKVNKPFVPSPPKEKE